MTKGKKSKSLTIEEINKLTLPMKLEQNLEQDKLNKKYELTIVAIICSTLLGIPLLIGIFWGGKGLETFGMVLFIMLLIVMFSGIRISLD